MGGLLRLREPAALGLRGGAVSWLRALGEILRNPTATSNQEAVGFLLIAGLAIVAVVVAVVLLWYALR